ncbi:hypothetical protein HOY80DRAFT_546975 [Tuber brumale]|nr:hypothetical protein HOY80DRAFT_546975 [Tuber brumale]
MRRAIYRWRAKDLLEAVGMGDTSRLLWGAGVAPGVVEGPPEFTGAFAVPFVVPFAVPFVLQLLSSKSLKSRARAAPSSFNLIASPWLHRFAKATFVSSSVKVAKPCLNLSRSNFCSNTFFPRKVPLSPKPTSYERLIIQASSWASVRGIFFFFFFFYSFFLLLFVLPSLPLLLSFPSCLVWWREVWRCARVMVSRV